MNQHRPVSEILTFIFLLTQLHEQPKIRHHIGGYKILREVYGLRRGEYNGRSTVPMLCYRCGFAQSQEAYDIAVKELFRTLDMVGDHLGSWRYLCGDELTLADICLITTSVRFDIVYTVLFKCTKKKLIEDLNFHAYLRDIYQIPKVAATLQCYTTTLFPQNPGGRMPVLPSHCEDESLYNPHNRSSLSTVG